MKNVDNKLRSDRISVLENILLTSESDNEKLEAISQLIRKTDDRAQLAMLKAFKDNSRCVREKAINKIKPSRIPNEVLVPYLVSLLDDKVPEIRVKAIQLLKEMKKREFLPYFLNKLNDENDLVRSIAIQAMSEIEYDGILESVAERFYSETSVEVKCALLQAIAKVRNQNMTDFLIAIMREKTEDVKVRSEAALGLAKSGSSKAYTLISSLIKDEKSTELKIGLIRSLASLNEERTVDFLVELSKREFQREDLLFPKEEDYSFLRGIEDRNIRDSARIILSIIRTLGILGNEKAIPFLLDSLNSVYEAVRLQSVAALFLFNSDTVNEHLLSILNDKNEEHPFKKMMLAVMEQTDNEGFKSLSNSLPKRGWEIYRARVGKIFALSREILEKKD